MGSTGSRREYRSRSGSCSGCSRPTRRPATTASPRSAPDSQAAPWDTSGSTATRRRSSWATPARWRAERPALARRGARVTVFDLKPAEELAAAAAELAIPGVELRLGSYEGIEEAGLIVPSPGVPAGAPVLVEARRRGVPVMAEIELAGAIAAAPIIAVTGTNGKTTTVMMTAAALREAGQQVFVGGNALAGGYQLPLIAA